MTIAEDMRDFMSAIGGLCTGGCSIKKLPVHMNGCRSGVSVSNDVVVLVIKSNFYSGLGFPEVTKYLGS